MNHKQWMGFLPEAAVAGYETDTGKVLWKSSYKPPQPTGMKMAKQYSANIVVCCCRLSCAEAITKLDVFQMTFVQRMQQKGRPYYWSSSMNLRM